MASPLLSINPLTLEIIGEVSVSTQPDVSRCFRRSRQAAAEWNQSKLNERLKLLSRLRKFLFQDRDRLASLLTRETGKPVLQSYMAEVFPSLYNLKYLIRRGPEWLAPRKEHPPFHVSAVKSEIRFEPLGLVAILGTWNYPLLLNLSSITEALIAGNTVIFKPSELSLMTAQFLEELFQKAGFPEGVFQVVYGGPETGQAVLENGPDKVFFTGSVAVGRLIYQKLAAKGIPCVLELSGNDPLIVRSDANLSLAVRAAVWGTMLYSGQNCIGTKRVLVHRSLLDSFKKDFVREIDLLQVGDPNKWETHLGPLRRELELRRCEELVQDAVSKGAEILTGGKRFSTPYPGFYFQPTVLTGIRPEMKVWHEDFFGPIALIDSFNTEEEAAEKANSVPLGLGASVFSGNLRKAEKLASRLKCGMVSINEVFIPVALPMFPFGGTKASGFGRMRGLEGLREMVNVKTFFARSSSKWLRPHYFQKGMKQGGRLPKWIGIFYK